MARPAILFITAALAFPASASAVDYGKGVFNVLPPGQAGSLPPSKHSAAQLPPYDGPTALFDTVTDADIHRLFKPETFGVTGKAEKVERPRKGLRIVRDSYGVPHVYGKTRSDVEFGAGWVTAEDRSAFIEIIRGPARIAALDVPGVNAFNVATSLRQFVPTPATEREIGKQ